MASVRVLREDLDERLGAVRASPSRDGLVRALQAWARRNARALPKALVERHELEKLASLDPELYPNPWDATELMAELDALTRVPAARIADLVPRVSSAIATALTMTCETSCGGCGCATVEVLVTESMEPFLECRTCGWSPSAARDARARIPTSRELSELELPRRGIVVRFPSPDGSGRDAQGAREPPRSRR